MDSFKKIFRSSLKQGDHSDRPKNPHVLPYPVTVKARDFSCESACQEAPATAFDESLATKINKARLEHLDTIKLPLESKSVIDVGCGVGHLAQYFVGKSCKVCCVDGRSENIQQLGVKYPRMEAHVADAEKDELNRFGIFDVVFCYGLLYHLESPYAALRNMASVCSEMLILETLVCDSSQPILIVVDEDKRSNQALQGVGCRPSPSYVTMALNRVGFNHVYAPTKPPDHEDFIIDWKDNQEYWRNNHNLRCIFVATRNPLDNPSLVDLIQH